MAVWEYLPQGSIASYKKHRHVNGIWQQSSGRCCACGSLIQLEMPQMQTGPNTVIHHHIWTVEGSRALRLTWMGDQKPLLFELDCFLNSQWQIFFSLPPAQVADGDPGISDSLEPWTSHTATQRIASIFADIRIPSSLLHCC